MQQWSSDGSQVNPKSAEIVCGPVTSASPKLALFPHDWFPPLECFQGRVHRSKQYYSRCETILFEPWLFSDFSQHLHKHLSKVPPHSVRNLMKRELGQAYKNIFFYIITCKFAQTQLPIWTYRMLLLHRFRFFSDLAGPCPTDTKKQFKMPEEHKSPCA